MEKSFDANIDLHFQRCAFSRFTSCKRKPKVPDICLLNIAGNYSSNFCKQVCLQTLICICIDVHFPGLLHAKESQTLLINACLKSLQITALISENKCTCKHKFALAMMCISRYTSCKREPTVADKYLRKLIANYRSIFCKQVLMQTLICMCNGMHLAGILLATESQTFLINACLTLLQTAAPIFANKCSCKH